MTTVAAEPFLHVDDVLTPEATAFVVGLHETFDKRRCDLLALRRERQARFDAGERPDFFEETAAIRSQSWRVPAAPRGLVDRRVEITGPVERKMMINALELGCQGLHGRLRGRELARRGRT